MPRIVLVSAGMLVLLLTAESLNLVVSVSSVDMSQVAIRGGNMTKSQLLAMAISNLISLRGDDDKNIKFVLDAILELCNEVIDD